MMTVVKSGANEDAEMEPKKSGWKTMLIWFLVAMPVGYLFGDYLASSDAEWLEALSLSIVAALAAAFILLFCAALVGLGALSAKLAMALKMAEDREQWEDERAMLATNAVGCFVLGVLLGGLALVEPMGWAGNTTALVAVVVTTLVLVLASWRAMAEYDELWREVINEAGTWGFYGVFAIGGGWSMVAQLGFAPPLAPLDWITLMTVVSLVASIVATGRRGMIENV